MLTAAAVLLLLALPASAQNVAKYQALVEQYAGGDIRDAVTALVGWTGDRGDHRLSTTIDDWILTLSRSQIRAPFSPEAMIRLRAAAMMQTDFAYALMASGQKSAGSAQVHNAEHLITVMATYRGDDELAQPFAIRWYALATSMYMALGSLDDGEYLVRSGVTKFPRAAELYLARGTLLETRAAQAEHDPRTAAYRGGGRIPTVVERLLGFAASDFQHALDLDSTMASAHLHRGWIYHHLGDNRASRELGAALAGATTDSVRYLAHLFLGATAEQRNDLDAARQEFEAALAVGPYQSAYVALGRVEAALGHAGRARELSLEYADMADKVEDPWWDFGLGAFNIDALAWLRDQARRP